MDEDRTHVRFDAAMDRWETLIAGKWYVMDLIPRGASADFVAGYFWATGRRGIYVEQGPP